ncbi:hypothetical protein [Microvirga vignae]|uniref:hypothetical protein n=1 Tax=Microvirga vignae TaxID=1225564 RepID=UPI0013648C97|nr:hypothetical protein [Microvirga vignae]
MALVLAEAFDYFPIISSCAKEATGEASSGSDMGHLIEAEKLESSRTNNGPRSPAGFPT